MLVICVILSQIITAITADEAALYQFKQGNVRFSGDLYKNLYNDQKGNFMVSPLSLELALAFLQSGAKGETAAEIRTVLHLPSTEEKIQDAIKKLVPSLTSSHTHTLNIANKIYIKKNFSIKTQFTDIATRVYQAEAEEIDFSKNNEAAETINHWVEDKTNNKIKNLISPNNLDSTTMTVIINTIYLNGNWSVQFEERLTKKSNFYKCVDVVQTEMMHQYAKRHKYGESRTLNAKFLEMDLEGQNASVVFVLPNNKKDLPKLEANIHKVLHQRSLNVEYVDIALPKFLTETSLPLDNTLNKLGIKAVFDPQQVDLSNMAGDKGAVVVNAVLQKTFIEVKEGGIEAAAATAIIVGITSVVVNPSQPKQFIADHPFIYFVKVQGVVVFLGRVTDPSK